ncbi:hypothetical protein OAC17_03545 [Flavobacteriaceae bacterium]|nr:hypothetical protein [Flavobacteriaceae bacterium]
MEEIDKAKAEFFIKYKSADFKINYNRYKKNPLYRFNTAAKFYTRKVSILVWFFCLVGGAVIMVNFNEDLGRFLFVLGFFALIAYYGNLGDGLTAGEWGHWIKGAAWLNNKCHHCWKTISKAATKCPHCTADLG